MPVVTAAERRCELPRRRDIGIAVEHVADLVRIFFVHTRQRQLRKTFGRLLNKSRRRIFLFCRSAYYRDENQRRYERLRPTQLVHFIYRLRLCWSLLKLGRRRFQAFACSPSPADRVRGRQLPAMQSGGRRTSQFPPPDMRDGPAAWFRREGRLRLI